MMDDKILLFDSEKTIAAIVADPLGETRIIWLELQLRPVEADEFGKVVQGKHAIENKNLLSDNIQFLSHESGAIPRG